METTQRMLSSAVQHVQTRSIERVLAPIAAQVSQLLILNESAERDGHKLPNLIPFAQQVLRATEDLVQIGHSLASQSTDEELCNEMPKACNNMKSTGCNVLMAVQRLQAEPHSDQAKANMVMAGRRLLQATVKVLLVSDGAEVRHIIQTAHVVLDRLGLVQSVESMKALVASFKAFTEAVMTLSNLCDRRQQELTEQRTKERIVISMDYLRKAVPMLSAAMQTYVKYPSNTQAKASRDYIINQVSTTVLDIISLMGNQLQDAAVPGDTREDNMQGHQHEEPGHFAIKLHKLILLLSPNHRTSLREDFRSCVECVARHGMAVGSLSREKLKEQITVSIKQILKQRNLILDQSEGIKDNPDFRQLRSDYCQSCEHLAGELMSLEKLVKFAIIGQTVDAFVETVEPLDRMVKAATTTLKEKGPLRKKDCIQILQPLEDTFHEHADRMCQLGSFAAASCTDIQRASDLLRAVSHLERIDPEVFPACLAVRQDTLDKGAVQHLKLIRREWQCEVQRLVEAVDDVIDRNRFLEVSESYMENDLEECRQAEIITDHDLLAEAANNLLGRAIRVAQVACNRVEASQDPIFRNGLKVHIDQLEQATTLVKNSAQKALSQFHLKRAHQQLTERGHHLMECVHSVGQAILGRDHPDILNPLRVGVGSGRKPKAEDFPDYEESEPAVPRLRFSNESYLSKPLPASEEVLAYDPAFDLTDGLSALHVSVHTSDTQRKDNTPIKLTYPMTGLVRELFVAKPDPNKVDKFCTEAENKSAFLASLATRASDCSREVHFKKIQFQALQLVSQTSQLTQRAKASFMSANSTAAEVTILAETWTSLANDIQSGLAMLIGCWGLPGNKLMEVASEGRPEVISKEIDNLNFHVQTMNRLVQGLTEASQAITNLNQSSAMSNLSSQAQLLQKEASDWTKLTHGLISAANEMAVNPDEPLLQDLITRRWLNWSVKQLELVSIMDGLDLEMGTTVASLATVAMEGSHDKIMEHVQMLKDYTAKMGHMVENLLNCAESSIPDSLIETKLSLDKLSKLLSEAVVSCSRSSADGTLSNQRQRNEQRVCMLSREWSAKAQILATHIDHLTGDMATPLDRLGGAARAVCQATGSSKQELLDEFQAQSDGLCSAVSGVRQTCSAALKSAHAGPLKSGVIAAVDALCRLTPQLVTLTRNIADGHPVAVHEIASLKREWACSGKAVILGLQNNTEVTSTLTKDVESMLRSSSQILSSSSLPLGIPSGFAPRNHSTPSNHKSPMSAKSSTSQDGHNKSSNMKESPTRKHPTVKDDVTSTFRSRPLGIQRLPRSPELHSNTSLSSLQAPRPAGGLDALNFSTYNKCSTSIAAAASVLQQETDKWEDDTNSIVKVAKTISTQMYDMARYARKINNPAAKAELIKTAKAIAANGKVIHRFAQILAQHCLDERVSVDLRHCAENIPFLCTQLGIIASVKTATPNDDTTDIVLMKNADNVMQAVLDTLKAAEAVCVKGLSAVDASSQDEEEARALATQWRLRLEHHRQLEASYDEIDSLGLRRQLRNVAAPALTQIMVPR